MVFISSNVSIHVHHPILFPVVLPSPPGHLHFVATAPVKHNDAGFDVLDESSGLDGTSESTSSLLQSSTTGSFEHGDTSADLGFYHSSPSILVQHSGNMSLSQASLSSTSITFLQHSTKPLLPVHRASQLEVILSLATSHTTDSTTRVSSHPMQTKLRTCVISRKNYDTMTVTNSATSQLSKLPDSNSVSSQVSRLSLPTQDIVFKGYTAVLSIVDTNEPTSFKVAVSQSHWREAMTEEFIALQK